MKTKRLPMFLALLVIIGVTFACATPFTPPTPTPMPTYTLLPTYTPYPPTQTATTIPTDTPMPTPTPKPTVEDILSAHGYIYNPIITCEAEPCRVYQLNTEPLWSMEALVMDSGQFRLGFVITNATVTAAVSEAKSQIQDIYGPNIANWFVGQLGGNDGKYNAGHTVIDGHWIGSYVERVDSSSLHIILIVSPDENLPIGVTAN